MTHLNMRLQSLVRDSGDLTLLMYVTNNLGKGVPPTSKYYETFNRYRTELLSNLIQVPWNPRNLGPVRMQLAQQEAMKQAMLEAEYTAFIAKQLQQLAQEQAKFAEMIDGLLRELSKEEPVVIVNKLIDPDPMMRWLAVQVGGKKRMPIEHDLIKLLADPHPLVRQAAHDALFRLSRGTDFGPEAKATAKQIAGTQRAWREWLAIQTDARFAATAPTPMTVK